jgi:putative membrane protein
MTDRPTPSAGDLMAAQRTELAFQRTRIAADRTMMAIMRTSLSLIGFGFTIFSFFRVLQSDDLLGSRLPDRAPALFGLSLTTMGVVLLALGIAGDIRFMQNLKTQRQKLIDSGLADGLEPFPRSLSIVGAILLLLIGVAMVFSILLRI